MFPLIFFSMLLIMYVCMYAYMYVCMYVCMYAYMYVCIVSRAEEGRDGSELDRGGEGWIRIK